MCLCAHVCMCVVCGHVCVHIHVCVMHVTGDVCTRVHTCDVCTRAVCDLLHGVCMCPYTCACV